MAEKLTHLRNDGTAHMVDVSAKAVTARVAEARGRVLLSATAIDALRSDTVPKGDALAVARIAGIQAAKRTPDLVPLAHPIAVHAVAVDLTVADDGVGNPSGAGDGNGLAGLRERALAAGAVLITRSVEPHGFSVTVAASSGAEQRFAGEAEVEDNGSRHTVGRQSGEAMA